MGQQGSELQGNRVVLMQTNRMLLPWKERGSPEVREAKTFQKHL